VESQWTDLLKKISLIVFNGNTQCNANDALYKKEHALYPPHNIKVTDMKGGKQLEKNDITTNCEAVSSLCKLSEFGI